MPRFPSFIEDGQTLDGYCAPIAGLHDGLSFTFRPILPEEQSEHIDARERFQGRKWAQYVAKFAAARLAVWSLSEPPSPTKVLRLQPRLFGKLYGILLGTDASDINPAWPDQQKQEAADEELESALTGQSPAVVHDASTAKN
jgi:hypothetical protein